MKHYPSIPYYGDHWGVNIIAFDKLDGSNLRFEWGRKRGFYKFGTRKMMIDERTDVFGKAIPVFLEKYADGLSAVFSKKGYRDTLSFVCFAEMLTSGSAFGQHGDGDIDVVLFDVDQYKRGYVPPRQFIGDFGHLGIPRVVHDGSLNKEFVADVKRDAFGLSEGVICKGKANVNRADGLYYCKIKTDSWYDRLRAKFGSEAVEKELAGC